MHGNNSWNISRSVVVDDAEILVLIWTENMELIHEHACSEYVQAIVKVYVTHLYKTNHMSQKT